MNGAIEFSYRGLGLRYNPETGQCWKKPRGMWKLIKPGMMRGYTVTRVGESQVPLHRIVAEVFLNDGKPLTAKQLVDHKKHIDGTHQQDKLSNLRICSQSENQQNQKLRLHHSSIYKGVSWHRRSGKWQAAIKTSGKLKYLGDFTTQEAAALAYNVAASNYFGEFAFLNPIPS